MGSAELGAPLPRADTDAMEPRSDHYDLRFQCHSSKVWPHRTARLFCLLPSNFSNGRFPGLFWPAILVSLLVSCGPDNATTVTKATNADVLTVAPASQAPALAAQIDTDDLLKEQRKGLTDQDKWWAGYRERLATILEDVAFQKQKPLLEAFYGDANNLREKHHALMLEALSQRNGREAQAQWFDVTDPYTSLGMLLGGIDQLPNLSREDVMRGLNGFFKTPTKMDRCRPIVTAYISANEEIHARFKVDLQKIADVSDRWNDLPQEIAKYVKEDDYLSAEIIFCHVDMLVQDLRSSLVPFEIEVYDKSHPGK
jgi:hypothetical protein